MHKKVFTFWLMMALMVSMYAVSWAEQMIIEDCSEGCQGHVLTGENSILIASGAHHITLDGVCIDVAEQSNTAAFAIERGAEVCLMLVNENTLRSGENCAGLQVPDGASLTITEESTGILNAFGGMRAAGIGGGAEQDSGTITICGGFVHAKNGNYEGESGAGIGGGRCGDGGNTTISGGVVYADGGEGAAGIGGGYEGWGGDITITGGIIVATSPLGYSGAGIGGGAYGNAGRIHIKGGVVRAYTSYCEGQITGAGIGGGADSYGGNIVIDNGLVIASAGAEAAGIGASGTGISGEIEINGGVVQAYGGEWGGAGIGGKSSFDSYWDNNDIVINGGVTIAEGGYTQSSHPSGAGIGGSGGERNPFIGITGGYVHATAGSGGRFGGAGIGSGGEANSNDIIIEGGRIVASAKSEYYDYEAEELMNGGAGIGSGSNGLAGNIVILGGRITAVGRNTGAGIGDGERLQTVIQIDGGSIAAGNDMADTGAIVGDLEYAGGEVISNGKTLTSNAEAIDYYLISPSQKD